MGGQIASGGWIGGQIATLSLVTTVVSVFAGAACALCLAARNVSGGGTIASDWRVGVATALNNKIRVKQFFFIGAQSTADLGELRPKSRFLDTITISFFVVSVPRRGDL